MEKTNRAACRIDAGGRSQKPLLSVVHGLGTLFAGILLRESLESVPKLLHRAYVRVPWMVLGLSGPSSKHIPEGFAFCGEDPALCGLARSGISDHWLERNDCA